MSFEIPVIVFPCLKETYSLLKYKATSALSCFQEINAGKTEKGKTQEEQSTLPFSTHQDLLKGKRTTLASAEILNDFAKR